MPLDYNNNDNNSWAVDTVSGMLYLPRSEYREVPAPERWTNITDEVMILNDGSMLFVKPFHSEVLFAKMLKDGYQFKKVRLFNGKVQASYIAGTVNHYIEHAEARWAFIVEKLEP